MTILLRMRNYKKKRKLVQAIKNTQFMFEKFFSPKDRAVYEVTWKNTAQPGRLRMTISHMRIACRITTDTNAHSEYVIFIVFQLQQWLQARSSMLRYTYTACLVMLRLRPVFWLQNMTHLLFSALLDDRTLNSKTLMRSPIWCLSTVYKSQRKNVCTYGGCL
jgi:hypothetical protein